MIFAMSGNSFGCFETHLTHLRRFITFLLIFPLVYVIINLIYMREGCLCIYLINWLLFLPGAWSGTDPSRTTNTTPIYTVWTICCLLCNDISVWTAAWISAFWYFVYPDPLFSKELLRRNPCPFQTFVHSVFLLMFFCRIRPV